MELTHAQRSQLQSGFVSGTLVARPITKQIRQLTGEVVRDGGKRGAAKKATLGRTYRRLGQLEKANTYQAWIACSHELDVCANILNKMSNTQHQDQHHTLTSALINSHPSVPLVPPLKKD